MRVARGSSVWSPLLALACSVALAQEALSRELSEAERAQIFADISGLYPGGTGPAEPDIVAVSDVVDGVFIVAFNPAIREVPNVLIYRANGSGVQRVTEGLSVGIELARTQRIDLHTLGKAADIANPTDSDASSMAASAVASGLQPVGYGRFMHLHEIGSTNFLLDKTGFEELRLSLFSESSEVLAHAEALNSCILYDLPTLDSVTFSKEGDRYVVDGTTSNRQRWTISFASISVDGHLADKEILAIRTPPT